MDKEGIYIVLQMGGGASIWGFVAANDVLADPEAARLGLKERCDGAPARFLSDLIIVMEKARAVNAAGGDGAAKEPEKSKPKKE